jgi:hypothetical protein
MPAPAGNQYAAASRSITAVSECWIACPSLSSGADPDAGDDTEIEPKERDEVNGHPLSTLIHTPGMTLARSRLI